MDQKKLYGRWNFWEEFVGYPMMIYFWIRRPKMHERLRSRIEKAQQKSSKIVLDEKLRNERWSVGQKKKDNKTNELRNPD